MPWAVPVSCELGREVVHALTTLRAHPLLLPFDRNRKVEGSTPSSGSTTPQVSGLDDHRPAAGGVRGSGLSASSVRSSVTLNVYAHVRPARDREAAERNQQPLQCLASRSLSSSPTRFLSIFSAR